MFLFHYRDVVEKRTHARIGFGGMITLIARELVDMDGVIDVMPGHFVYNESKLRRA